MRSLPQSSSETKKFPFLSSSVLCFRGWGGSSLEILQVCRLGSSQLGNHIAKRCSKGFLEVYRVTCNTCKIVSISFKEKPHAYRILSTINLFCKNKYKHKHKFIYFYQFPLLDWLAPLEVVLLDLQYLKKNSKLHFNGKFLSPN